ncbi:MAG: MFS transporter [Stackebrandtia sp.]
MLTVLKRPDYRLLFIGTSASTIGDTLMFLTLGIWVKDLTGSDGAAGLTMFFLGAPTLLAPLAGMLADRVSFRPFLIIANLGNAAVLLPLVFVAGPGTVWLIYLVAVLLGIGMILDTPALNGLLKTLLPAELLVEANGATQTVKQGLRLVGPIAGAGIYLALGGFAVAIVDAATFLIAAGAIALLKVRQPRRELNRSHWWRELTAGFRFVAGEPVLRRAVAGLFLGASALGAIEVVGFALNDSGLGRGPAFISVIVTVMGIGGLIGGLLAARVVKRVGELTAEALGLFGLAVTFAVWAVPTLPGVLASAVLAGLALPVVIVADNTLIQKRSPADLVGRVSAACDMMFTLPQMASLAAGALLVTLVDFRLILVGMALLMTTAAVYIFAGRRLTAPNPSAPTDVSTAV